MKKYSEFFQTLHDETAPTGHFGRGTHYSVFRTLVWRDIDGNVVDEAKHLDFSVIWDEDHDDRVFHAIELLHQKALLNRAVFIGERKGTFTVLVSDATRSQMSEAQFSRFSIEVAAITDCIDADHWPATVGSVSNPQRIIDEQDPNIILYLKTISLLWQLGVKEIH